MECVLLTFFIKKKSDSFDNQVLHIMQTLLTINKAGPDMFTFCGQFQFTAQNKIKFSPFTEMLLFVANKSINCIKFRNALRSTRSLAPQSNEAS